MQVVTEEVSVVGCMATDWVTEARRFHPQLQHEHPLFNKWRAHLYLLAHLSQSKEHAELIRAADDTPTALPRAALQIVAGTMASFLFHHNRCKDGRTEYLRDRDASEEAYLQHVAATGELVPGWVERPFCYTPEDLENTWLIGGNERVGHPSSGPVEVVKRLGRYVWHLEMKLPVDTDVLVAVVHQQSCPSQEDAKQLLRQAYPHSMDEPPTRNAEPHWHTNLVRACLVDGAWRVDTRYDTTWHRHPARPTRASKRLTKATK